MLSDREARLGYDKEFTTYDYTSQEASARNPVASWMI
jgi:hypothetical protein